MNFKQSLHDLVEAEVEAAKWKQKVSDLKEKVKNAMDDPETGFSNFKLSSGVGCVLEKPQMYASFDEEDREKVVKWCNEKGIGDIFKRSVHYQTFSANMRALFDEGEEIPPFIKTFIQRTLKITGRKHHV